MFDLLKIWNLSLFDGDGAPGGEGEGESAGEEIPSSIPARARENYRKAVQRTRSHESSQIAQPNETETPEDAKSHVPYSDLIKSDEYKAEHKEYMDRTISDRLKKYKGIEETSNRQAALLELVAQKYGIKAEDENYLETLKSKIEADDSYFENYAMEHDISPQEARKIVSLERKVAEQERAEKAQREEEVKRNNLQILMQNAERTKARFPDFDLDTEWKSESFRRLVDASHGDTTAAYMALHWNDVLVRNGQQVARQAVQQTTNAVMANKNRPVENGLSSVASSITSGQKDFRNMSLSELRKWAEEQRRR